jgi:hypothetical protein
MQKHIRKGMKMANKITNFFREYIFIFSNVLTILGLIVFIIGVTSILEINFLNLSQDVLNWSLYILALGFILLLAGSWYLYSFFNNRKFILEALTTNKRSELIKKHSELKIKTKRMPSKYQQMLKDLEEEFKIK